MYHEDIKQKISHLAQKHSSIPENDFSDFGNSEVLESEAFHMPISFGRISLSLKKITSSLSKSKLNQVFFMM
jgi:hypothetical protein